MIRVLVAEDHPLFRDALVASLGTALDVDVVGAVGTGTAAVSEAARTGPDVVVMDLQMPDGSGLAATAELTSGDPSVRVLVLTSHEDDHNVNAALRAGAHGYLLKTASADEILAAVHAVAHGDAMFSGAVLERLTRHLAARGSPTPAAAFPGLTRRETEILELMAQGHSNTYIADHFVLSIKTVRNHVSNVMSHLGVDSRAAAVARARDAGIGVPTEEQRL